MGSLMSMAILTLLAFHYSQLMEAKPLPTTFCASLALVANQGKKFTELRSLTNFLYPKVQVTRFDDHWTLSTATKTRDAITPRFSAPMRNVFAPQKASASRKA